MAFCFSMRRCSLVEINHRLRRTVLNTLLRATFLRKRFSKEPCDSPGLKTTLGKNYTTFLSWNKCGLHKQLPGIDRKLNW